MKKRFAMSAALAAALSMVGMQAALAHHDEDSAAAEEPECIYCLDVLQSKDFGVVPMGELVAGEPISHWAHLADEWFLGMPVDQHYGPQQDCQASQGGPVFFLQNGPFGRTSHFECEIQPDQYVLITPGGGMSSSPDEPAESLVAQTLHNSMFMNNPRVNINGTDFPVGGSTWIVGEPFSFQLPENNILGAPAEEITVHTAGWYVMLEPLSPGTHSIVVSDDWLAPAYAPWDVDAETGVLNEEFVPVGSPVKAAAVFDITVPDPEGGTDEAAADAEATTE